MAAGATGVVAISDEGVDVPENISCSFFRLAGRGEDEEDPGLGLLHQSTYRDAQIPAFFLVALCRTFTCRPCHVHQATLVCACRNAEGRAEIDDAVDAVDADAVAVAGAALFF